MNSLQIVNQKKWASLFLLTAACAHRDFSDAQTRARSNDQVLTEQKPEQHSKKDEKIGLYGIDGSLNTCKPDNERDLTIICQLLQDSNNAVQKYFEGVKDFTLASDQGRLDLKVAAEICNDVRNGTITKALIVGYSRGAISALVVAEKVNRTCPLNGNGVVMWLGLVDAVETSLWHYGRLPRDYGRNRSIPDGVSALHLHKKPIKTADDSLGLVSTTQLRFLHNNGSQLVVKTIEEISHDAIGRGIVDGKKQLRDEFLGYRILKQAAIDQGAVFYSGAVPKDSTPSTP